MLKLKSTRHLLLGVFDFIVIGVVIYGMSDWVYDGYPAWVPYSIIVFFLAMATIRFFKFSANLKKSNSVDSHDIEDLFSDDSDSDDYGSESNVKGFRRRGNQK